jgi:hypothetical protein
MFLSFTKTISASGPKFIMSKVIHVIFVNYEYFHISVFFLKDPIIEFFQHYNFIYHGHQSSLYLN